MNGQQIYFKFKLVRRVSTPGSGLPSGEGWGSVYDQLKKPYYYSFYSGLLGVTGSRYRGLWTLVGCLGQDGTGLLSTEVKVVSDLSLNFKLNRGPPSCNTIWRIHWTLFKAKETPTIKGVNNLLSSLSYYYRWSVTRSWRTRNKD